MRFLFLNYIKNKTMDSLPPDIIKIILPQLNIYQLHNLSLVNKFFYQQCLFIKKKYLSKAIKIVNFFETIHASFADLKDKNRNGYLSNYKKIYQKPELYLNKKIQFLSKFEYLPYTVLNGTIEEGYLIPNDDGTYVIHIDNQTEFPYQLLFQPFIFNKSLRVIKD